MDASEHPTPPESPLSGSLGAPAARERLHQPAIASAQRGACGHELDPWESHVEHHPECPYGEELEILAGYGAPTHGPQLPSDYGCTCPEVCPACCRECS